MWLIACAASTLEKVRKLEIYLPRKFPENNRGVGMAQCLHSVYWPNTLRNKEDGAVSQCPLALHGIIPTFAHLRLLKLIHHPQMSPEAGIVST